MGGSHPPASCVLSLDVPPSHPPLYRRSGRRLPAVAGGSSVWSLCRPSRGCCVWFPLTSAAGTGPQHRLHRTAPATPSAIQIQIIQNHSIIAVKEQFPHPHKRLSPTLLCHIFPDGETYQLSFQELVFDLQFSNACACFCKRSFQVLTSDKP